MHPQARIDLVDQLTKRGADSGIFGGEHQLLVEEWISKGR